MVCRWWRKETTQKKRGGGFFFAIFVAIFALLVAAAEEHLGVSRLPRPRGRVGGCWGSLGAAGAKSGAVAFLGRFCSSLWPSLGQVTCTGQPPHRRGRVPPDKRVPPLPWWWSHSNPNPPTRVGWVPGWWWREVEHPVGYFFFCGALESSAFFCAGDARISSLFVISNKNTRYLFR